MSEVVEQLSAVRSSLASRDAVDTERRKTDDARYDRLARGQEDLVDRVDKHGLRTTAIETQWTAFFGEQGAFRMVLEKISGLDSKLDKHGEKQDKMSWYIAVGIGVLAALQFVIPIWIRSKQ